MSKLQWRIFWASAITLVVLLVGVFAFIEPKPPAAPRNVYGFEQYRLRDKHSKHATPSLVADTSSEGECYRGGVDWSLGRRQYPIDLKLSYDRRHRLQLIDVRLDHSTLSDEELETASELARNYFSSRYAADTMHYTKIPGKELETIEIIGENDNVVTVTFEAELLTTITVAKKR